MRLLPLVAAATAAFLPPPIFLHSIPFSFVRRSNYRLPLIPSSDGSRACAAEMVRYRKERNNEP